MQKQGEWPKEGRRTVNIETPNGSARVNGGRVTVGSFEPGARAEKLPYRDTVTGQYRERVGD